MRSINKSPSFLLTVLLTFVALSAISQNSDALDLAQLCKESKKNSTNLYHYKFELDKNDISSYTRSNQGWVKFAQLPCPGGPQIVYQNSSIYPIHFDFLSKLDDFNGLGKDDINAVTLKNSGRKVLLGVIRMVSDGFYDEKVPTTIRYQLISDDPLSAKTVFSFEKQIKKTLKMKKLSLEYYPSPKQRDYVFPNTETFTKLGIAVSNFSQSDKRKFYASGWSAGKVMRVKAKDLDALFKKGHISTKHILVMDEVPTEIPPVAGVVTSIESAPFSHVALMSQMMGSTFYYEKDAYHSQKWKDREGTNIFIHTKENGNKLDVRTGLTDDEVALLVSKRKSKVTAMKTPDIDAKYFVDISKLKRRSSRYSGSKAANLGFICNTLKVCPKGFAIPFYYFENFLEEATMMSGESLATFFHEKMNALESTDSAPETYEILAKLRTGIKESRIPPSLFDPIYEEIVGVFGASPTPIRFRSSSNVEDLESFNGAGLYLSKGAISNSKEEVSEAIRKVWASLYNDRAYLARKKAGISEYSVSMAVLVQSAYKGELARGVAIAKGFDYGDKNRVKVTLTGFPGEELKVTNPIPGRVPETAQLEKYSADRDVAIDIRVASSEVAIGQRLLPDALYEQVFIAIQKVFGAWRLETGIKTEDLVLDFEWKWMPDQGIILKQVRPVPQKGGMMVVEQNYPTIVGGSQTALLSKPRYTVNALLGIKADFNMEIDMDTFDFLPSAAQNIPIRNIRAELVDGSYINIPRSKLAATYQKEGNAAQLKIDIPHPEIPSLQMILTVDDLNSEKFLENPIRSAATLRVNMSAVNSDVLEKGSKRTNWDAEIRTRPFEDTSAIFTHSFVDQKKRIKVIIEGLTFESESYDARGLTYYIPNKVTISGILSKPFVLDIPAAMTYAADDHNCCWEWGFDLSQASSLTKAQKVELKKAGGPYLVISNEGFSGNHNWEEAEQGVTQLGLFDEKRKLTLLSTQLKWLEFNEWQ